MTTGNSILMALLFSGVFLAIGSSVVVFNASTDLHVQRLLWKDRLLDNSMSGINILLADEEIAVDVFHTMDLFGDETDSVRLSKKRWGGYEILISEAFHWQDTIVTQAVSGYTQERNTVLYIPNSIHELTVSGNTFVNGDAFLPDKRIKRGRTDNQPFQGEKLINGNILDSGNQLPELSKEHVEVLRTLARRPKDQGVAYVTDSLVIQNSFLEPTKIVDVTGSDVSKLNISGNIILYSSTSLKIPGSCRLDNVIVTAPSIIIEKGFSGSCQLIGRDSILIEPDCELLFPSAAVIVAIDKNPQFSPFIKISKNSFLGGFALLEHENHSPKSNPFIEVEEKALVRGIIYSTYDCMFNGHLEGMLVCQRLRLEIPSGTYSNHLLNAKLDAISLKEHMVFPSIVKSNSSRKLIRYIS